MLRWFYANIDWTKIIRPELILQGKDMSKRSQAAASFTYCG